MYSITSKISKLKHNSGILALQTNNQKINLKLEKYYYICLDRGISCHASNAYFSDLCRLLCNCVDRLPNKVPKNIF